jgi:hypothetical protein
MVKNAAWNLIFQTAFQKTLEISNDLLAALSHIREDQQTHTHTHVVTVCHRKRKYGTPCDGRYSPSFCPANL